MVQIWRQVAVLLVALALWAVWAEPALWALVACYGAALLLVGYAGPRAASIGLTRLQGAVALCLVAAPALAVAWRNHAAIADAEGLAALVASTRDRVRIEATPAIAPPIVSSAEPQVFFVHAPGSERVAARFGATAGAPEIRAERVGDGLFRVSYDPRRDGGLPRPADGPIDVALVTDGDQTTRRMMAVSPLAHPRWIHVDRDRRLACATSEETDELFVLSDRGIERRVPVGDGPTDCAFSAGSRVAVSHRFDDRVWLVEARSGAVVGRVRTDRFQAHVAATESGELVAITTGGLRPAVHVVSSATGAVERVALDEEPDWIAFGPTDATLVVSTRRGAIVRLDRDSGARWRATARLAIGALPVTLARARAGERIWIATTDFRPNGRGNLGNHFVQDQLLAIDVRTMRVVERVPTPRRTEDQTRAGDVDSGCSPMGIAETASGALLVSFAGTDELWRVTPGALSPEVVALGDALPAPHGVAELRGGAWLADSPSAGAFAIVRHGEIERILRVAPSNERLLHHDLAALARRVGERAFYEATRSGISCQSCHAHGASDDGAHNLGGHRLLPTLTVRGLAGTAPYLRDGSYPRVRDLEELAHGLYRGYRRSMGGRGEVLEAFVYGLPRPPNPRAFEARDRARERRGYRAFVKAECPTCHAPPAFTRLGAVLARSLFPEWASRSRLPPDETIDMPSLLSVGTTPPYLSDGRARTLRAVLEGENRSNLHGDVASLSEREVDDLIAFLESL